MCLLFKAPSAQNQRLEALGAPRVALARSTLPRSSVKVSHARVLEIGTLRYLGQHAILIYQWSYVAVLLFLNLPPPFFGPCVECVVLKSLELP